MAPPISRQYSMAVCRSTTQTPTVVSNKLKLAVCTSYSVIQLSQSAIIHIIIPSCTTQLAKVHYVGMA